MGGRSHAMILSLSKDGRAERAIDGRWLGARGSALLAWRRLGLPIPAGFVITCHAYARFLRCGRWPRALADELAAHVSRIEASMEKGLPGGWSALREGDLREGNVSEPATSARPPWRWQVTAGARPEQIVRRVVDSGAALRECIESIFRDWRAADSAEGMTAADSPELGAYPSGERAMTVEALVEPGGGLYSGSAVVMSRDPDTGSKTLAGDMMLRLPDPDSPDGKAGTGASASGVRRPQPVDVLRSRWPDGYAMLKDIAARLERFYRDAVDFEMVVRDGRMLLADVRPAARSPAAAVRVAVDMAREGLIDKGTAVLRVSPATVGALLHPTVKGWPPGGDVLAVGLPASPGVAVGRVAFTPARARAAAARGEQVILVRDEVTVADIGVLEVVSGVLARSGGPTSHGAIIAREIGVPAVVGARGLRLHRDEARFEADDRVVQEGDWISLDGGTGTVIRGRVAVTQAAFSEHLQQLLAWADDFRRLEIRANADSARGATAAVRWGAEGIGLCRTEHMFRQGEGLFHLRVILLAEEPERRRMAMERLGAWQRDAFLDIFRAMQDKPVAIRLLDPVLSELLPDSDEGIGQLADALGVEREELKGRIRRAREGDSMLGRRGSRLGIVRPEVYEVQVRAIVEAAAAGLREGIRVVPEVILPFISSGEELQVLRARLDAVARRTAAQWGVTVPYSLGVMVEVPRAALVADEIAAHVDFMSFGTNDLTQLTYGMDRDRADGFLAHYIQGNIWPYDPFRTLDVRGVGELIELGISRGRSAHPELSIGICGEQAGDPEGIWFCHGIGANYVSCSPRRLPVARLAAAQVALRGSDDTEGGLDGGHPVGCAVG